MTSRTFALAALLCLAAPAIAPGLPPPVAPWVVTGDVNLEGVPLLVLGDVVVASGGSLVLRGVEASIASAGVRPLSITVQAGGQLVLADGAAKPSGATAPTRLSAPAGSFSLILEPGGVLRADNASLRDAFISLAGDARLARTSLNLSRGSLEVAGGLAVFDGGSLTGSPGDLLHVTGGAAALRDVRLDGAAFAGVRTEAGTALRLENVTIANTGGYGVYLQQASAVIANSTFTATTDYAFRADGSYVDLRGNHIDNHCAAFLMDATWGSVEGNVFDVHAHGVSLRSAGVVAVRNNTFRGASEALSLVDSAFATVENNTFEDNNVAVLVRRSGADFHDNTFARNNGTAWFTSEPSPASTLRHNSFQLSRDYALRNDRAASVDAASNWWGASDGPAPGGHGDALVGAGPVTVAPWLTAWP